jgi:hypothetical protein
MSSFTVIYCGLLSLSCLTLCVFCVCGLDASRAATFIVSRTALYIWQVSDSITISTNTHPTMTLSYGYVRPREPSQLLGPRSGGIFMVSSLAPEHVVSLDT